MSENNILRLIEKFEQSLESTEKLTNIMMGLEGALGNLDSSITEVYELTKMEDLTKKSSSLLTILDNLKSAQKEINNEYDDLINLKLYKDNLLNEIKEIKSSIKNLEDNLESKIDKNTEEIKEDIKTYKEIIENSNKNLKEELLLSIKEMLENNNQTK